jgi:predicted MFS family arabinose efflux permease
MILIQKQRLAIAAVFFMNGFGFANLMSRIPEIQTLYGMTNATLGTILFCRATGALLAMPTVGRLSQRFSSHQITLAMGLAFAAFLPSLVLMPSLWFLAPIIFFFGMSEGILGAGCGVLMVRFAVAMPTHLFAISAFSLSLILFASQFFIKTEKNVQNTEGGKMPLFMLPTAAILPLGIIAFCGMTGEGAMVEWSTVFMKQVLKQKESHAALALVAFNAAMLLGRTFGDKINHAIGEKRLLIADSLAAIVGLVMVLALPYPLMALLGFFIIGLGLSTIVPIIYSAAGNTEGVSPSVGIAMATSIGYAGFFVGPPTIGYLSELTAYSDLRWGLVFILLLFIVMLFLIYRKN